MSELSHDDQDWIESLPPLVRAAEQGARDEVIGLLSGGSSPNESDDDGWSALHAASFRGHADVVRELLTAGAEIEAGGVDGFTPLLNASGPCENPDVIALLLSAGADPNFTDNRYGWTPLSRAVEYCRPETVRLLIEAGADGRAINDSDYTLLMTAAEEGCVEVIGLLLEAGANPEATCEGTTATGMAQERGFDEFVKLLSSST